MKNQALKLAKTGLLVSCLFWSQTSFALFIFSGVSYSANSVSFTIDGDMTEYAEPDQNKNAFSIRYQGDIWSGLDVSSLNTWSQPVFANLAFESQGRTGGFDSCCNVLEDFSGSSYITQNLSSAMADKRDIKLTLGQILGQNYLNETATSGIIEFLWGNGQERFEPTVLGSWDISASAVPDPPVGIPDPPAAIPEPSIIALFAAGLFGVGLARRRLT